MLFQIVLFAENAKGRSKPLVIETQPARDAVERRTERIIDGSLKASSAGGTACSVTPLPGRRAEANQSAGAATWASFNVAQRPNESQYRGIGTGWAGLALKD